jgi:AraC-like DNA-binding protein
MFNIIIIFFSAFLGMIGTVFILKKNDYQKEALINRYLILITSVASFRLFFHGVQLAYPTINILKITNFWDVCIASIIPCFYLYFENIINEVKFNRSNLKHFIMPISLIAIYFIGLFFTDFKYFDLIRKILTAIVFVGYFIYSTKGFILLKNHIWFRKSEIKSVQLQNKLIKDWSIFLYIAFISILLIRILESVITSKFGNFDNGYLWMPGLIWISIHVKIILTPEILYGYNFLNKSIDAAAEKVVLNSVWFTDDNEVTIASEKDKKLQEKINPLLKQYIHQIEEFSFYSEAFRNTDLSIEDISNAVKIPVSHINYIFKYHCRETFTDFKKIVRIHDATKLIETGFLKTNTIESLSTHCGFSSYNTFNMAFKSITGITTQEYAKKF